MVAVLSEAGTEFLRKVKHQSAIGIRIVTLPSDRPLLRAGRESKQQKQLPSANPNASPAEVCSLLPPRQFADIRRHVRVQQPSRVIPNNVTGHVFNNLTASFGTKPGRKGPPRCFLQTHRPAPPAHPPKPGCDATLTRVSDTELQVSSLL
jgi:hypothetical protein